MRSSVRRSVASITAAAMLAGCVSTQAGRIGVRCTVRLRATIR